MSRSTSLTLSTLIALSWGCSSGGSSGGPADASFEGSHTSCGNGLKENSELCDGTDHGGLSCQTLGLGEGTLTCEPDCTKFDTSQCAQGCQKDCSGRTCGADPVCGFSCGTCATGTCNASGQCVTDCSKDCSGRVCGADPVCGLSCGTCATGTCSASGQCEASSANAPTILSLSSNVTSITQGGAVTVTAVVTDPDGIDDLIGGTLTSASGATYGPFVTSAQEGAYSITVSWWQLHEVEKIEFAAPATRNVVATFYDVAGHTTTKTLALTLHCDGIGACDGACTDLKDDREHCETCGNDCGSRNCYRGQCGLMADQLSSGGILGPCSSLCKAEGLSCGTYDFSEANLDWSSRDLSGCGSGTGCVYADGGTHQRSVSCNENVAYNTSWGKYQYLFCFCK